MPTIRFELCAVPVIITAQSSVLLEVFREYFRYYHPVSVAASPSPELNAIITINLKMEAALPALKELIPDQAQLLSQAGSVRLWHAPQTANQAERFYVHTPVACFTVTLAASRADGIVTPQALPIAHILTNTYALFALLLLLRSRCIYHLHAAAVVSPDDKLFLFCGEQRSGKTTLTTALGIAGWKPVSDDSLLIHAGSSGAKLTALRKSFHLSNEILSRWSQLAGMASQAHDPERSCVAGLELFETVKLAEGTFSMIDHIVLPQITGEDSSRIEKITMGEAILRLAEQSMFFQLWPNHTKQQMNLLTQLARKASGYRLLSGKDILSDPSRAAQLLNTIQ